MKIKNFIQKNMDNIMKVFIGASLLACFLPSKPPYFSYVIIVSVFVCLLGFALLFPTYLFI